MRKKNKRTTEASRMPITPQTIQAGKNDPRILNVGAREHPVAKSVGANDAPAIAAWLMTRARGDRHLAVSFFPLLFGGMELRAFRMKQVAGLEG
jgi:hypothetical protein